MPYKINSTTGVATKERDDTMLNRAIDALIQVWTTSYDAFSRTEAQYIAVIYALIGMAFGSKLARRNVNERRAPFLGVFG